MNSEEIIQKAVRREMLTEGQIQECVCESGNSPGQDLLDILLAKGYLNQIQLKKLSEEDEKDFLSSHPKTSPNIPEASDMLPSVEEMTLRQENEESTVVNKAKPPRQSLSEIPSQLSPTRLPELPKTPMNTPFGKAAVLLKMVTKEQAYDALLAQASDLAHKKLGEIMVDKGYLTLTQVKKILSRQKTKTMGCMKCEKKYQIVLFQAGRSYKCKICKFELEDAKKLKKKKNANDAPEKLQVMGLTQAMPMMKREKQSASLGFIDEKPTKVSQPQPLISDPILQSQEEQDTVEHKSHSTEEQLKSVGLDIPEIIGYRKRPVSTRKNFAPFIFSGVIVLIVFILVYVFIIKDSSNGESELSQNSGDKSETLKPPVDLAQKAFKELPEKATETNETDLSDELNAYREYVGSYPKSPHREEVDTRINEIEQILAKKTEYRKWKGKFEEIESEIEELRQAKNFNMATAKLKQFLATIRNEKIEKNALNLQRDITLDANDEMAKIFAAANAMVAKGKYQIAISTIAKALEEQIEQNKPKYAKMIADYRDKWQKYNREWNNIAVKIIYEIYPLMLKRDYGKVRNLLDNYRYKNKKFTEEFKLWQRDTKEVQRIWDRLQYQLKLREGKITLLKLDKKIRQKFSIEGKLTLPSKKSKIDRIHIEKGRRVTTINIEWLNESTICHLLAGDHQLQDISERAALTIFLLPWKNTAVIASKLSEVRMQKPQDDKTKYYRKTIAYYLVAMAHFAIEHNQKKLLAESLQELDMFFGNTLAFEFNKARLREEMSTYEKHARNKKNAARIAQLIDNHLRK